MNISLMRFSNLQKNIFQKTILNLKFKFPANNIKFQAQDSFLEIFFWRFGDLKKRIALSEKKPPLALIFFTDFMHFSSSKTVVRDQQESIKSNINPTLQAIPITISRAVSP